MRDVCDMDKPAGFGDKKILREVTDSNPIDIRYQSVIFLFSLSFSFRSLQRSP